MSDIKWWGYIHINGSLQLKRFFKRKDIDDAHDSPFIQEVFGPWTMDIREVALEKLKECAVRSGWIEK